ncbi:hypothetical protein OHA25_35635 [Nonomuraea sp. NBC_00507]|uniref:hypothetical protein n=1 Tax=Nonomuraea sp. NBC_00507 TaxID=2976002 RepID=UPI002E1842F2
MTPGLTALSKAVGQPLRLMLVTFIDALTPNAGPPLVIGSTGSTDTPKILDRINAEVLFDRQQPAEAAAGFVKQVGAAIQ